MAEFEFKIEKDIPVPLRNGHAGRWIDLVRQLKVGDSFFIPEGTPGARTADTVGA